MVSAQAQGVPVEDLSQRTESTQTFANPDGTWSTQMATGPERVQQPDGSWTPIDTTLVQNAAGEWVPRAAAADVSFSDGGSEPFATMAPTEGSSFGLTWPEKLPEPVVQGSTLTYSDVVPNGDLVVEALPGGFSHEIVLHQAPTQPVDYQIPLELDGLDLVEQANGALSVRTDTGKEVASAPAPLMWDHEDGPAGEPETVAPLTTTVDGTGADAQLVLTPDMDVLTDPATQFPVTLDPTFSKTPFRDVWVQNADYTNGQVGSPELRAGTYDGGGHKARSFLDFDTANLNGKHILSATLKARNFASGSCANGAIRANAVTDTWNKDTLTWANQPAVWPGNYDDYANAYGYTGCPDAGWAQWNVLDMVRNWTKPVADGGWANRGIRLKAVDETSNATWRKYRSANYTTTTSFRPHLEVDYNSYPDKAGTPTVSPGNAGYSTSATPTIKAILTDPDGGELRGKFTVSTAGTDIWTGYSCSSIASAVCTSNGGTASVTVPAGKLNDGVTYTVKAWAEDGTGDLSKNASTVTTFKVDTSKPSATVTASAFSNNQWTTTVPASNTFTFDGPDDTKSFSYTKDGVAQPAKAADSSGNGTLKWLPSSGAHTLTVTPTDQAGKVGNQVTFKFGVGPASFSTPNAAQRSTAVFPITIAGPPNATRATLSWRYTGKTQWTPADGVTTTSGTPWSGTVSNTSDGSNSTSGALLWDATEQKDPATNTDPAQQDTIAAPASLELQTCFTYNTTPSQVCSDPRPVQLVPSAFDGAFPVTNVGPAVVALFSGEMTLTEPDAVDTAAGIDRVFSSFDASTTTDGPFGKGWSTSLIAAGDTAAELVDNRGQDHTFVLVTAGGSSQTFTPLDPVIDPVTASVPVTFRPAGLDDGSRMVLDGTAVTLTRPNGPVTRWEQDADGNWLLQDAASTESSRQAPEAGFEFSGPGYPTWIAETEPGVSTTCTQDVQEPGCRGLKITYTGVGANARVSKIERIAHNTAPVTLATYSYVDGMLDTVCGGDPDSASAQTEPLCAHYDYVTMGGRTLLQTATPPGQKPWEFHYDTAGRLTTVTRALDAATNQGVSPATWTVAYDLSPATAGLPDLSAAAASEWGQTTIPANAVAVFGPEHVPNTIPTSDDLTYASLWYTDGDGKTTNTAAYGAGQWLVDTQWYDDYDNVIRTLDGAGRARALAAPVDERPAAASDASSWTIYNDDGDEDHDDGDGTRVEDEFSPVHTATLTDGTSGPFRAHTAYTYDDEDPTLGGDDKPAYDEGQNSFNLVVEVRHSASDPDMLGEHDPTIVRNEYGPIVDGDGNGWELGIPTRVKTQLEDGSWSTQVTRFDDQGRELETRQPGGATTPDGSGNDAHTITTTYYTPGAADHDCDTTANAARAEWGGLVCKTGPADQLTGPSMPVSYYADYNDDLQPTRIEETSGATTRVTTATFDAIGRSLTTTISDGSDTRTATTGYDPTSGLPTTVSGTGGTTTTVYDTWGRPWKYTDASGLVSTTTYTHDGLIAALDDGEGTYTYTYDGASGEHRRVPTSVDIGLAGGVADTFDMAYNSAGTQSSVTYPNGLTAAYGYDELGNPNSLDYSDGSGQTLLSFDATRDVDGRIIANTSTASAQDYTYDALGRLTKVQDTRNGQCTTRTYGFSAASERTAFASFAPDTSTNGCQTTTPTLTKTNTYDTANRIRNAGYAYDDLGRTTTLPASDTAPGGAGPLAVTYFANDMVASLTQAIDDGQGGTIDERTNYQLDATDRIDTVINQTHGVETSRLRYRFSDENDAPSSIQASSDQGASWSTTRYVTIPGLGMAGTVENGVLTYEIANLRGDVVATQAQQSSGIDSYNETDEYGNPIDPSTATPRYGWLGAYQRSGDSVGGLVLMGARMYNPATGLFLTPDPVVGGGANRYAYPTDPINMLDLSGDMGLSAERCKWPDTPGCGLAGEGHR